MDFQFLEWHGRFESARLHLYSPVGDCFFEVEHIFLGLSVALVPSEFPGNFLARGRKIDAELFQDQRRHAAAFPQQAEEHMFGQI